MKLQTKHIRMLERVFGAEINGALPFQTKSTVVIKELEADGYVEHITQVLKPVASCPVCVRVSGYVLTHRGRIAYCDWAQEQPGAPEEE